MFILRYASDCLNYRNLAPPRTPSVQPTMCAMLLRSCEILRIIAHSISIFSITF